jgi:hypothetical protein
VKEKVKSVLSEYYGSCIFFEHGRAGSSLTFTDSNKHCYHAHLHCVPAKINLNQLVSDDLRGIRYNSYDEVYLNCESKSKYLYVEDDDIILYEVDKPIRRQYLRFKLAESLGKGDLWNWVEHQNWDIIESTIYKLEHSFNEKVNLSI